MARKHRQDQRTGNVILVVDDSLEYLEAARLILERDGHEVLTVTSGPEALDLIRQQHVDLLLLDYYMPDMTGEEVITALRRFNSILQVILQTGYSGEQPPRDLMQRLDIQGYYDKSEGPERLLLWADVGLKTAETIHLLHTSRQCLNYILDITPDLHKIQPLEALLHTILSQVVALLNIDTSVLISPSPADEQPSPLEVDSFLAMFEDEADLIIRAGTGRFAEQTSLVGCLTGEQIALVRNVLQQSETCIIEPLTLIPLRVGDLTLGVVYLDMPNVEETAKELLQVFANQAAVAIQNSQLYEMAALDPLTGVYVRRFFDQYMQRELRTAFRTQQPVALLMIDMDGLKVINDTAGHIMGDQALTTVGRVLRHATRDSDIVGRYGGDEFAVVLLQGNALSAEVVAKRILNSLNSQKFALTTTLEPHLTMRASIGIAILRPHKFSLTEIPRPVSPLFFQHMAQRLTLSADEALYEAKRLGGNCARVGVEVEWLRPNLLVDKLLPGESTG